jgi:prepilin-type processing-associated H-X9-DG protein
MVGESVQKKIAPQFGPYWGAGTHTSTHGRVFGRGYPFGNDPQNWLPNAPWPDPSNSQKLPYAWVFSSKHPGGVNMLFGDGSVKFIKDNISINTWASINTIRNGEIVDASSFQ